MKSYLIIVLLLLSKFSIAKELNIEWSTYYANGLTNISVVRYDSISNCIYIAGYTGDSTEVATTGRHKSIIGPMPASSELILINKLEADAFIAKFSLAGEMIWGTYLGGDKQDYIADFKIDYNGDLIVVGSTYSSNGIATAGTFMPTKHEDTTSHGFIAKFDSAGHRIWGTYFGVSNFYFDNLDSLDQKFPIYYLAVDIDRDNNIYIGTYTHLAATTFSTIEAYQPAYGGGENDGVIMKFNTMGNRIWSTYFGGNKSDQVTGIKIGSDNHLYIVGNTNSTGLGTVGTYQSMIPVPDRSATFISKFSLAGSRIWTTYVSSNEAASTTYIKGIYSNAIDVDTLGNIYIVGKTNFTENIATAGTHQSSFSSLIGYHDLFVMKFDKNGLRKWGTYYGGDFDESMGFYGITIGRSRIELEKDQSSLVIAGVTNSYNNIEYGCGYKDFTVRKGFISRFDSAGNIIYGSFFDEMVQDFTLIPGKNADAENNISIVGRTMLPNLATTGAHKDNKDGYIYSAYITKFTESCPLDTPRLAYTYPDLSVDTGYESYTWYHNGVAVSSGDSETYTPGVDTTGYYYAVVQKCGCTYTTDTFYFDDMSIGNQDFAQHFQLFPNPTEHSVQLRVLNPNLSIKESDIFVYNLLGQSQNIKISQLGAEQYQIDLNGLPAGTYQIQLRNQKGQWSQKVVKW